MMAERRKTRSGEKDEDDNRARMMKRTRKMKMEMRRNDFFAEINER